MRVARLIACLVIGVVFPGQLSSLFGQGVATLIHDVSDMADGSVTQARLEAQRQAASGDLAYRSYTKGDPSSFSGKYTPPELPDEKKGRFVYGLALFSDDGCNVTVNRSLIHPRMGQGQHLPNIGDSFHVLQVVLAPGEPVDITVDYSNIIYDDDPDSPGYPDIDGCTLFLYLLPMAIAVDANRDGTIAFSGTARDTTSQDAPFRFWCNDDDDHVGTEEGDIVPVAQPDYQDDQIEGRRDLEDFARLHLFIDAFQKELTDGTFRIGLKWKNVTGPLTPAIKVYRMADARGSDSYLNDDQAATNQVNANYRNSLGEVKNGGEEFIFPADSWGGFSEENLRKYLLFEGSDEGKGQLVVTLRKADGIEIGEGPGVWLDLKNIKKMYVRGKADPESMDYPHTNMSSQPNPQIGWLPDPNGHAFEVPTDEAKQLIVFVHGINGPGGGGYADSYNGWINVAETVFKRLWQQGYEGRFAFYKWSALTPAFEFRYNDSEYRGFKCGRGLAGFVNGFPSDYKKNLYSFSQGAVVCGAALTVYALAVDNYVMSQAAAPAGCYDTSSAINNYPDFLDAETQRPTPDWTNDLGYRGYLGSLNVSGSVVSFYNTVDYALKTGEEYGIDANWEANQIVYKPNANLGALGYRTYAYDSGPPNNPYPIGKRCFLRDVYAPFNQRQLTDIQESMAFVARPRSEAAGASTSVAGPITGRYNVGPDTPSNFRDGASDHGGQFSRRIQQTGPYYRELGVRLRVLANEAQ